jgi:CheY-like chemotaxis protein
MCKILIIDDEKITLQLVEEVLTKYGHNVETADSGNRGLHMFERNNYDMIITDINMPDINGFKVAQFIRRSDKCNMPIVCITGELDITQNELFNFVIKKPFFIEEVIDAIENIIEKERLSA